MRRKGAIYIHRPVLAIDVKVVKGHPVLTEGERKIAAVLFLNICVATITGVVGTDVKMDPLEREDYAIFQHRFSWIAAISEEQANELRLSLMRRIQTAATMAGIEEEMYFSVELSAYSGVN